MCFGLTTGTLIGQFIRIKVDMVSGREEKNPARLKSGHLVNWHVLSDILASQQDVFTQLSICKKLSATHSRTSIRFSPFFVTLKFHRLVILSEENILLVFKLVSQDLDVTQIHLSAYICENLAWRKSNLFTVGFLWSPHVTPLGGHSNH